jgi:hypothetical protein
MNYKTSDLDLATTLLCYGFKCVGVDTTNQLKNKFEFTGSLDEIRIAEEEYDQGDARVDPKLFAYNRRELVRKLKKYETCVN